MPTTYEEWKAWALAEDERSGADLWKLEDHSSLYDYRVIRRRYDELAEIRRSGDPQRLLFYLNEGLHGNMGGMGAPALYARARFGTKELIAAFVEEMRAALSDIEAIDERIIGFDEKLSLFRRTSDCFGRSALMLSGAGSLGAFHIGVVKALAEQDLVPNVVSGASAGSVVAAVLGTHRAEDFPALFSEEGIARRFEALRDPQPIPRRRRRLRIGNLRELIEAAIPDMTFGEAFEETGRRINVSVAPASLHQRSRLLNASTSANACIREAVLASCAVPGVFPPVTLAAKDGFGKRKPYVPSRQWVDGSITDDQPARRLARLYGVNHFIASQANPIAFWAVKDPHGWDSLAGRLTGIYLSASRELLRTLYPFAMDVVRNLYPMNVYTRLWFSVMTQDYTADVNIIMRKRFSDPTIILALLSTEESDELVRLGERTAWPKLEMIRLSTEVSRHIDRTLTRMQEGRPPGHADGRRTARTRPRVSPAGPGAPAAPAPGGAGGPPAHLGGPQRRPN